MLGKMRATQSITTSPNMTLIDHKSLLNNRGMRATPARLEVLAFVESQDHPIGIEVLKEAFPSINEVTLYRMATDFVSAGLWVSCDLGHGHADYESANRPHHHHAVCESCGVVEEVYGCDTDCALIASVRNQVKTMQSLRTPSTPLFGVCTNCAT